MANGRSNYLQRLMLQLQILDHSMIACTSWYTQTDDKRTAIDIAILKGDLTRSGGHTRWIEGANMLADPLTKKMRSDFLRAVCKKGYWTFTHHGNQSLRKEFDLLLVFR